MLENIENVGQYLATKILVIHVRHRDLANFIGDVRRFNAIGLFNEGIAQLCRNHLQVKRYRRNAAKQQVLAGLRPALGMGMMTCDLLCGMAGARFNISHQSAGVYLGAEPANAAQSQSSGPRTAEGSGYRKAILRTASYV